MHGTTLTTKSTVTLRNRLLAEVNLMHPICQGLVEFAWLFQQLTTLVPVHFNKFVMPQTSDVHFGWLDICLYISYSLPRNYLYGTREGMSLAGEYDKMVFAEARDVNVVYDGHLVMVLHKPDDNDDKPGSGSGFEEED